MDPERERLREYIAKRLCRVQYGGREEAWNRIAFHKHIEYRRMADDMIEFFMAEGEGANDEQCIEQS